MSPIKFGQCPQFFPHPPCKEIPICWIADFFFGPIRSGLDEPAGAAIAARIPDVFQHQGEKHCLPGQGLRVGV